MKCSIMFDLYLDKKDLHTKEYFFFYYNLTPLDMYNGLSHIYCIKPEGRIHHQSSRKRRITRIGTHVFSLGRMFVARQEFSVRMFF